jgi:membrane dipeptidase
MISEAALALHRDALVWDNHSGFMPLPDVDLGQLRRWRDAGVDYLSVDVCFDTIDWLYAIRNLAAYRMWVEKHPDEFLLIDGADDIDRAKAEGKLAIGFDIEGMSALNGDLGMVSLYYKLGVRQMLFAYNLNNAAGGGCHDGDAGITPFGRDVVREMNRVGMLVDVTHCSHRTSMEAMELSAAPVIFSHSNALALCDHGRNIADDQILACARTGGVVGINGIGLFLGDPAAGTEALARHVAYVAQLAGIDHVGIALDYNWGTHWTPTPEQRLYWPASAGYGDITGIRSASPGQLVELTQILLDRGFSDRDVRKILGGNFMRVARQVWR